MMYRSVLEKDLGHGLFFELETRMVQIRPWLLKMILPCDFLIATRHVMYIGRHASW